jgi:hypothetical protein
MLIPTHRSRLAGEEEREGVKLPLEPMGNLAREVKQVKRYRSPNARCRRGA